MKLIFFWHVADFILPLAYSASIAILLLAYAGAIISLCVVKKSRIEEANVNQSMFASFIWEFACYDWIKCHATFIWEVACEYMVASGTFALDGGDTVLNHQSLSGSLRRAETRLIRSDACWMKHWTKRWFTSWPQKHPDSLPGHKTPMIDLK